jgi:hypothetical protein
MTRPLLLIGLLLAGIGLTGGDGWLIERHGFRTPSQVRAELTGGARAVA